MNYINIKNLLPVALLLACMSVFTSCTIEEVIDPNGPSLEGIVADASIDDFQKLVTGVESGMRNRLGTYHDGVGVIGREWYRFSGSDPRFTSDLLGKGGATLDDNTFYTTGPFAQRYRTVRNCNIILDALENTTAPLSAEQKSGLSGFANTIMAYELSLVLAQQYNNGIRTDVRNPDALGPFRTYTESLSDILSLLNKADDELGDAGSEFVFTLTSGFSSNSPADFRRFNRAIAARIHTYNGDAGSDVLSVLGDSFLDLAGAMDDGIYHPFSTAGGDLLNPLYYAPNSTGEARVAHPSFAADIEAGDTRISKVSSRDTIFQDGLESEHDVSVYTSLSDNMSIIRNEELILLYAEANINTGDFNEAVNAINAVRSAAGLGDYAGALSEDDLINELLHQRRYSLFGEGHRWIDMRRYNRLGDLPIDRVGDDVWEQFPRPASEG